MKHGYFVHKIYIKINSVETKVILIGMVKNFKFKVNEEIKLQMKYCVTNSPVN